MYKHEFYDRYIDWSTVAKLFLLPFDLRTRIYNSETGLIEGEEDLLICREFAATYISRNQHQPGVEQKEVRFFYKRPLYLKSSRREDMGRELHHYMVSKKPDSVHLGSVMSFCPGLEDFSSIHQPYGRELIFDVDAKDYARIRNCICKETQMCDTCWPFMVTAIHAMDFILRNYFNYFHLMWIFSGRRGIHCWVLDTDAAYLTDPMREGILALFQRFQNAWRTDEPFLDRFEPLLDRLCFEVLYPRLEKMASNDQINLASAEALTVVGSSLPPEESAILTNLVKASNLNNKQRWDMILYRLNNSVYRTQLGRIICGLVSPRLDSNVTPKTYHLIRCPMTIHHESNLVTVPLLFDELDSLDYTALLNLNWRTAGPLIQEKYGPRFSDLMLARDPWFSYLFCRICFHQTFDCSTSEPHRLGVNILNELHIFNANLGSWKHHMRTFHANFFHPSENQSTLGWLAGYLASNPFTRVENYAYKVTLMQSFKKAVEIYN